MFPNTFMEKATMRFRLRKVLTFLSLGNTLPMMFIRKSIIAVLLSILLVNFVNFRFYWQKTD